MKFQVFVTIMTKMGAKYLKEADMRKAKPEQFSDIYKDLSAIIGKENTLLIYNNFKGQQISFPVNLVSRDFVREQIAVEFDGTNAKELAKKYGYSERWVREIVKEGH